LHWHKLVKTHSGPDVSGTTKTSAWANSMVSMVPKHHTTTLSLSLSLSGTMTKTVHRTSVQSTEKISIRITATIVIATVDLLQSAWTENEYSVDMAKPTKIYSHLFPFFLYIPLVKLNTCNSQLYSYFVFDPKECIQLLDVGTSFLLFSFCMIDFLSSFNLHK
jgi:hypothetical protein